MNGIAVKNIFDSSLIIQMKHSLSEDYMCESSNNKHYEANIHTDICHI